jgi:hypothetical protein
MSRNFSRPFRIALSGVIAAHAAFLADYHRLTDGCFCAILGAGLPTHRTIPGELFVLRFVIGLPVQALPFTLPTSIGDSPRTVMLVLLNAAIWLAGLAALITLTRRLANHRAAHRGVLANHAG